MKEFKQKFGGPEETIIAYGDYSQCGNMRGLPPAGTVRYRRMFRRWKYLVFLVDEYHTSALCSVCYSKNAKFMKKTSKKRGKSNQKFLCHGLLMCQGQNCGIIWNRDVNAVCNIWNIAMGYVYGSGRPEGLKRKEKADN